MIVVALEFFFFHAGSAALAATTSLRDLSLVFSSLFSNP
jgi:hypothetical protein